MGRLDGLREQQRAAAAAGRSAQNSAPRAPGPISAPVAASVGLSGSRFSPYAQKALDEEVSIVLGTLPGGRNNQLNRSAFALGQLVGARMLDEQTVRDQLRTAALVIGLTETETDATLDSGLGAGLRLPRQVHDRLERTPQVLEVEAETLTRAIGAMEPGFWDARPILAHLHLSARARMVSPWAVLGAALARVICATPVAVHLPPIVGGKASLNLFVGLVGPSASGKGGAESCAREALHVGELREVRISSGEAIAHVYKRRDKATGVPVWRDESRAALISVTEIDRLAGQSARLGSTILADLRAAYMGELLGQIAADPSRSIPLEAHHYRLCLVAGIQPARAEVLLNDADGGTPQRFLWMPSTDPEMPDTEPEPPEPWAWQVPAMSREDLWNGLTIDVCRLAVETVKTVRRSNGRGLEDALDGHTPLTQLKVATAFGLLEGRWSVTEEDWQLAELVMLKSASVRGRVVATLERARQQANKARAEAEAERAVIVDSRKRDADLARVCRLLERRLTGEWIGGSALRKSISSADRGYFAEAIVRLREAGRIDIEEAGNGARYRHHA